MGVFIVDDMTWLCLCIWHHALSVFIDVVAKVLCVLVDLPVLLEFNVEDQLSLFFEILSDALLPAFLPYSCLCLL